MAHVNDCKYQPFVSRKTNETKIHLLVGTLCLKFLLTICEFRKIAMSIELFCVKVGNEINPAISNTRYPDTFTHILAFTQ